LKLLIILFLTTFYLNSFAQIPYYKGTYFSKKIALNSLMLIQEILKKNHPSYSWYTPATVTDNAFKNAATSLPDSISQLDFLLLATKCINNIKCGHTALYYTSKAVDSINKSYYIVFPFNFIPIKDTLVNINCFVSNNNVFKIGTKILTINGLSSKQIIDSLKPYFSGDGNSDIYRERKIGNNFPFIYRNVFGLTNTISITYLNDKNNIDTAQCFATNANYYLKAKQAVKNVITPNLIKVIQPLDSSVTNVNKPLDSNLLPKKKRFFIIDSTKKALIEKQAKVTKTPKPKKISRSQRKILAQQQLRNITIDTLNSTAFVYIKAFKGSKYRKFVKSTFKTLKKDNIKNVVFDVRDNGGGLISKYIYLTKFLSEKPFKVADTVSASSRKIFKRKYMKQGFWHQAFLTFFTHKGSDGRFHIRPYERRKHKPKINNHYNGNIYIITGAYSFSATTLFANNLKGQSNVTIVGDPTGGGHYGNSGVLLPDIKIPNTNLILHIPLFRVVINKNADILGGGLQPDVLATPSSESLFNNQDVKKAAVIALIKQRKI
jgi:hypothetical protein